MLKAPYIAWPPQGQPCQCQRGHTVDMGKDAAEAVAAASAMGSATILESAAAAAS